MNTDSKKNETKTCAIPSVVHNKNYGYETRTVY